MTTGIHIHIPDEFHLKDYFDVLRRRRDIIVLFFAATVLIVGIGSFIMRPVYRATVTLLIDPESPNVLTTTGMVELQSQNYFSYKEYYQSQIEIMTSYALVKKVFEEFGLGQTREYRGGKEPVKRFLKTIKIEPIRDTRLAKLNVDNRDPELAARIANRIAELYVMRNLYYISKTELLNLLKNEYLKLEARLSEYSKVYKDAHPEMIKLKDEMAEMTLRIDEEKRSVYNYANIEEYLKRDSKHALAGFKANNISIQDPAERPVVPVKPKKMFNLLMAIVIGLFGGAGLAFFFEYLDDTARSVEDVERVTHWPFLGSIPDIVADGETMKEIDKDLFVNVKPKDPISEVYRSIRTKIAFSSTEEHPLRCLLVTSPGPQEGKTTTLCNLGIAIAQNQKKVLLVDSDMRKPRLHDVFGKPNDNGLSNFLAGQSKIGEVIQKTAIENISLVSGGILPPNPSELLTSHKLVEFIKKAKDEFDVILFDSPPIAILTDAAIVSRIVDGTIIVVETGKTSKRVLVRLYQLLSEAKARIVGMVLNRISITSGNQYYYYSYYYADANKQ